MEELSTVEAQAQFARLIDRARKGEETVITDHGRPGARLSPVEPAEIDGFADWETVWQRMRERANAAGIAPFTDDERKSLRDEGRR
ncbi:MULTISPECIES: type II toxin-antitoxin system Phd/YefM family antitoxin [unclassified Azospirillum]|jgi:prevent-host-death family protein|uniref:type II toxin-antitoxin system Phd/YefM family antitoxin n=1 Tax=unclassified Azospirillum TaxID=2630922 RepID=UPI000B66696F|nr:MULTISPECIES: type II toxin-antitoxin system prevent-host-death family antitoxin [unclassified Azospirillum]SNR96253.1 prevent-host-death family protein [Azospirillum sp. RU38E]SNS13055.1 prevent-host-death family protein [Azospirillum sp. RU37A]